MEIKRTPKTYQEIDPNKYQTIVYFLEKREVCNFLYDQIIALIGPLTVRERWELLGNWGLESLRSHVSLEGSAYEVSSIIVDQAINWGYPITILLLQALDLGQYEELVRPFLIGFTKEEENPY